jgi:hypothetical protein
MKKIILLLSIVFAFSGCEKDDICDANTPTTPRLVIECYEFGAISPIKKSLTKLKAIGLGMTDGVIFNSTATDENKYLSNDNKIMLPLRTTSNISEETTSYNLILNSGVVGSENIDVINVKYIQNTLFVSRACGYKTLFNLTNTTTDFLVPDSNNWIKVIQIVKSNLENENEIHVKIYF